MTPDKNKQTNKPIQAFYPKPEAICYGCGPYNHQGLHINTYWDGKAGFCHFKPEPNDTGYAGFVYGGLIASLIDCHSIGTAVAAAYGAENRPPGSDPEIAYVTGSLNVSYLNPTPIGVELTLRSRVKEMGPRKCVVECGVYAGDQQCAAGEVTAVRITSRLNAA